VKAIQEYTVHRLRSFGPRKLPFGSPPPTACTTNPKKSEGVLRGLLKTIPKTMPPLNKLTQLLLDQNKAEEAISLLTGMIDRCRRPRSTTTSATLTRRRHDFAKAETAYRKATDLDPRN